MCLLSGGFSSSASDSRTACRDGLERPTVALACVVMSVSGSTRHRLRGFCRRAASAAALVIAALVILAICNHKKVFSSRLVRCCLGLDVYCAVWE